MPTQPNEKEGNKRREAKSYGFIPKDIEAGSSEDWIQSHTQAGKMVGHWNENCLRVFGVSQDVCQKESEDARSFEEALDCFSEGRLDYLLVGQEWYLAFPDQGKAILQAIQQVIEKKDSQAALMQLSEGALNDPFLLNQWGKLLSFRSDFTGAGEAFRQSVELLPEYGEPYSNLGALLWNLGKRREGFILFSEAFLKNPHRTTLQLNFFDAAHEMEEYEFVTKILEELIATTPAYTEFKHHLAICYHKTGRPQESLALLEDILVHDPQDEEAKTLLKGFSQEGSGAAAH